MKLWVWAGKREITLRRKRGQLWRDFAGRFWTLFWIKFIALDSLLRWANKYRRSLRIDRLIKRFMWLCRILKLMCKMFFQRVCMLVSRLEELCNFILYNLLIYKKFYILLTGTSTINVIYTNTISQTDKNWKKYISVPKCP